MQTAVSVSPLNARDYALTRCADHTAERQKKDVFGSGSGATLVTIVPVGPHENPSSVAAAEDSYRQYHYFKSNVATLLDLSSS